MLSTLFLGAVVGSIYSLSAFGLVLTYRTTRLFNFAHGAVGMLAAYTYHQLVQGGRIGFVVGVYDQTWRLRSGLALVLVVGVLAPAFGWWLDRVLFRWLRTTPTVVQVVATIGLLVALQGAAGVMWGAATALTPQGIFGDQVFAAGGFRASIEQIASILLVVALAAGLLVFLRRAVLGVRMRAVVDAPELAELHAVDAERVERTSWAIGTAFAALAGILIVPFFGSLDPVTLTFLVVPAAGAAVVGRLQSFPLTLVGGFGIGMAQLLVQRYAESELARGLRPAIPFLVLFGVLFLPRWRRSRTDASRAAFRLPPDPGIKLVHLAGILVVLAGAVVILPVEWQQSLSRVPGTALIFLSLVVLSGFAGQISLCQAALAGFGAFMAAHFVAAGMPFVLGAAAGAIAVVPLGAFLASRAVTLSPIFLGLATLAFGAVMDEIAFTSTRFSGGLAGMDLPRPEVLQSPRAYFAVSLVVFGVAAFGVSRLRRGVTGLHLAAMRDSEPGLESVGVSSARLKFLSFVLSAGLAGLGGAMLSGADQLATPFTYFKQFSLIYLAVAVIGGMGAWPGALLGAVLWQLGPPFVHNIATTNDLLVRTGLGERLESFLPMMFGIGAVTLARNPHGLWEQARRMMGRVRAAPPSEPVGEPAPLARPEAGLVVTSAEASWYHRSSCPVALARDVREAPGIDGLEPCPVCGPSAEPAAVRP